MTEQPIRRGKPIYDPCAERDAVQAAERKANTQEVSVGGPTGSDVFTQGERRIFHVHRACGHCEGSGRSKKSTRLGSTVVKDGKTVSLVQRDQTSIPSDQTPTCAQCLLSKHCKDKQATDAGVVAVWGQMIERYAFELTEAELNHLPPEKKLGALFEIDQHGKNAAMARVLCDQAADAGKYAVVFVVRHMA